MKLKIVIRIALISLSFINIQSFAQTILRSEPIKLKEESYLRSVGIEGEFVYYIAFSRENNNCQLLTFDRNTLKLKDQKEIHIKSKAEEINEYKIDSNTLCIETRTNNNNKYYYRFDLKTMRLISEDEIQFMDLYRIAPFGRKGHIRHFVNLMNPMLFDFSFMNFGFLEYIKPFKDSSVSKENTTKYGHHSDEEKMESEPITKRTLENPIVYVLDRLDITPYKLKLDNEEKKIIGLEVSKDNNDNCIVTGRYFINNNNRYSYGVFCTTLDTQLRTVSPMVYLTLIENAKDEKEVTSHPNAPYFDKMNKLRSFVNSENNYVEIFNYSEESDETGINFNAFGEVTGTTAWSSYSYKGFAIINFSSKGDIQTNRINIDQHCTNNEKLSSYICDLVNGKIIFLFNDNKKNAGKAADAKQSICDFRSGTVLMTCSYDIKTNTLSKKSVFDAMDNSDTYFSFNDSRTVNIYYKCSDWFLYGNSGKSVYIAKISF